MTFSVQGHNRARRTSCENDNSVPEVCKPQRVYLLGRRRLARDGDPEPIHIEENDTTFAIGWKGRYRVEGPAFIYGDHDTGQLSTILGYPTHQLK